MHVQQQTQVNRCSCLRLASKKQTRKHKRLATLTGVFTTTDLAAKPRNAEMVANGWQKTSQQAAICSPYSTIFVHDKLSKKFFHINSRAAVSLIALSVADRTRGSNGKPLTSKNGSSVQCYGSKTMDIQIDRTQF